jgi:hypothetical protein
VVLTDRVEDERVDLKHGQVKRWDTPCITVDSTEKKIPVGIDGSLHKLKAPVDIHIDHKVLRVVLPTELLEREMNETSTPEQDALSALSGPSS